MMNITALETLENRGSLEISFNIINIISLLCLYIIQLKPRQFLGVFLDEKLLVVSLTNKRIF